jgi:hypothetical protein
MSNATFVTVATFMDTFDAELARNDLQSAGLHAFLLGQPIGAVDWIRISTIGGIRLQVPSDEAERANAILEEVRSAKRARKRKTELDGEPARTQREENAYSSLKAAVFGLLFLVFAGYVCVLLEAYAVWLVIKVKRSAEPLSPGARRSAAVAGVIGTVSFILGTILLVIQLRETLRF